jgi:hypothetical protein
LGGVAAIIECVEREGSRFCAPAAGGATAPGCGACLVDVSGATPP